MRKKPFAISLGCTKAKRVSASPPDAHYRLALLCSPCRPPTKQLHRQATQLTTDSTTMLSRSWDYWDVDGDIRCRHSVLNCVICDSGNGRLSSNTLCQHCTNTHLLIPSQQQTKQSTLINIGLSKPPTTPTVLLLILCLHVISASVCRSLDIVLLCRCNGYQCSCILHMLSTDVCITSMRAHSAAKDCIIALF